jgi:ABC-type glycerol-3-phosphate transport system permease component
VKNFLKARTALKKKMNYRKLIQRMSAYLGLTLGAIIFLIPFFWLMTTSMKTNEEYQAQPPRWLPPLPYNATQSPFVAEKEFPTNSGPRGLSTDIWLRIEPVLIDSAWAKMKTMRHPLLDSILVSDAGNRLEAPLKTALINGTLSRIIQELRERIYEKGVFEIVTELTRNAPLTPETVGHAWPELLQLQAAADYQIPPATLDSIKAMKMSPKEEELYLAAWTIGLEQLGDFRWEERLKNRIDAQDRELWNAGIRFFGRRLWLDVIAKNKAYSTNRTEPEMIDYILRGLHRDRLEKILVNVYRNLALSGITVQSSNGSGFALVDPATNSALSWHSPKKATLPKYFIDAKQSLEVSYDLRNRETTEYQFTGKLTIPFEQVEQIILPIRGDLSYNELWLAIETNGQRFEALDYFEINSHAWMGAIWQRKIEGRTKKGGLTLGGQQLIEFQQNASATVAPLAPDEMRLKLTIKRVPFLTATWRKLSKNYLDTFRFVAFLRFFMNSAILTVLNIGSQLLVCPLIAYGFARIKWPGRDALFALLLATMMLPHQVIMIPQFLIFRHLGMYDTLYPLWLPSLFGTGFYIFLLRQFFMTIPYDYEEAAKLDGCGFIRRYFNISLPLIRPALAAVVIFQFMATWNDFLRPLIFLNSENKTPLPLGLFIFKTGWWSSEYGILMAAAVIMLMPVVLVFFMAQKHFIESISLTGSKG